ncbi:MAG TPA: DPP IV N-terminal domain-containing protein, partial [Pirellulaceae bacterium]|nr:DPP IV N-terminal domain-containing protein [Pirellulaceae bacterium]
MSARFVPSIVIGLSFAVGAATAAGQGTAADYQRAARLRQTTQNKVFRTSIRPQWLPGNTRLWYRVDIAPGKYEFVLVDAERKERQAAFDHAKLAAALAGALNRRIDPEQLPIDRLSFDDKGEGIQFSAGGKRWQCLLATCELKEIAVGGEEEAGGTHWLDQPQPSSRTGPETTITFVNRMAEAVELFWSDDQGQRRSYGKVEPGQKREQHTYEGHVWLISAASGRTVAILEATVDAGEVVIDGTRPPRGRRFPRGEANRGEQRARPRAQSPDGKWTVIARDNNLFLRSIAEGDEFALTTDGTADDAYSADVYWSPDNKRLAAIRTKRIEERKVNLIESSPRDQVQPKLITVDYAKPGDPLPVRRAHLFDVDSRREIPVSDELFATPYNLDEFRWSADSSRFTFLYNQRGHQVLRLISISAADGKTQALIEEQSPTFIDYAHKQYLRYLPATDEIIWMSERDGWNHLYLYDARTGQV